MKFEQNCSYIGGDDTKPLKSVAILFNHIVPTTTKKWHTIENDQELINIFEHKIYTFYIHL